MKRVLKHTFIFILVVMFSLQGFQAIASERQFFEVAYRHGNEIPLATVKDQGIYEARNLWGDQVVMGPVIPLCDTRGNILAYEMVFILSPDIKTDDEAIFSKIRHRKNELQGYKESEEDNPQFLEKRKARWGVGEYATLVMGARYDVEPILEYHTGLPPYFTVLDEARSKAASELKVNQVKLNRIYAAGYLEKWFEFEGGNRTTLVNVYSLKIRKPELITYLANTERTDRRIDDEPEIREMWGQRQMLKETFPKLDDAMATYTGKVYGVPAYSWYKGCSPTSAAMVLGYWDSKGYNQLLRGLDPRILINELAVEMKTESSGSTKDSNVVSGIKAITNTNRGYNFTVSSEGYGLYSRYGTYNSHWGTINSEIDAGRPVWWGVNDYTVPGGQKRAGDKVDHAVCVFGYKKVTESHWYWSFTKWDCYALVYTTWDVDIAHYWKVLKRSGITGGFYYSEEYADYLVKITPGYPPLPKPPSVYFSTEIYYGDSTNPNPKPTPPLSQTMDVRDGLPKLSWNSVSYAVKYKIYRRIKRGSTTYSWSLRKTTTSRTYTDGSTLVKTFSSTPPSSDWAAYTVKSVDKLGRESSFSNIGYYRLSTTNPN